MSGMSLRDAILGYDDNHRSTEDSRNMYYAMMNMDARPEMLISFIGSGFVLRKPCSEAEYTVTKIIEATFQRMMRRDN